MTIQQASYPLTFSPLLATDGELTSKLILTDVKDNNKPIKFEFDLKGTAEDPLAEGHRVVRCSARERVEQFFKLKNIFEKGELLALHHWDLRGVGSFNTATILKSGI